jgi:FkbM family methyltransferase
LILLLAEKMLRPIISSTRENTGSPVADAVPIPLEKQKTGLMATGLRSWCKRRAAILMFVVFCLFSVFHYENTIATKNSESNEFLIRPAVTSSESNESPVLIVPPVELSVQTERKVIPSSSNTNTNMSSDSKEDHKYTFSMQTAPVTRSNNGHSFSIEIYQGAKDIVCTAIRGGGWELNKVRELNNYFINYSKKHNVPLSDLTFIDIGANVGWFSLSLAALGVKVLAFEPMQENIELIRKSLKLPDNIASGVSDRIKLHPHGLGVKNEVCIIFSRNTNVGDGHVKCVENEADLKIPNDYKIRGRIPVHRLDDVVNIDDKDLRIVAIKMDTEGYEGNVLEGGTKVLLKGGADAIVTEFVGDWIIDKGGDPVEFMKKMGSAGYHVKEGGQFLTAEEMVEKAKKKSFRGADLTLHSQQLIGE